MTDVVDGDGPAASEGSETEHGGRGVSQGTESVPGEPEQDEGVAEADGRRREDGEADGSEPPEHDDDVGGGDDEIRVLRKARRKRRMRRVKVGLLAVTVVSSLGVATAFALAAWDVQHLTHNLKHTALLPSGFTEPPEPMDAFGRTPIDILLIGSDTRDTAADCGLGGACVKGQANTGANGDSEMIVHLSADRSNVTVLSIPRDTETDLPSCAGGGRGMINSALAFGPACQVAAVVKLTGIPIDHFVDFDFSGVIDLSNDIGGVPVCVSAPVHDPYSGLTIGGGTTNVQGKQALQFLRTRDAFYDGSDLGREQATHIFMSSMLRKAKQNATLTNLPALQSFAETLTRYTTVDNGLDSALGLIALGQDFGEVDSNRVSFLTMPWQQDSDQSDSAYYDRVEASPQAAAIFAAIKQDRSFTTSSQPGQTPSPSSIPTDGPSTGSSATPTGGASDGTDGTEADPGVDASQSAAAKASEEAAATRHPMHVNVVNASGTTQRYQTVVPQVFQDGFVYAAGSDATSTMPTTALVYEPQEAAAAEELAADLNLPASAMWETAGAGSTMVLTIGTDWTSGSTFDTVGSTFTPSAAISVPDDSYEQNGANTSACVQANSAFETGSKSGSGQ